MTEPSPHDGHMRFASATPLHSNVVPIPYMGHVHHISAATRVNVLAVSACAFSHCGVLQDVSDKMSRPVSLLC